MLGNSCPAVWKLAFCLGEVTFGWGHGIPVVDLRISSYLAKLSSSSPVPKSFCILTDRRNLVLAVNTADFPGNEIRMWYNPDEMENRQRAVFMAGCDVLDEGLVAFASRI